MSFTIYLSSLQFPNQDPSRLQYFFNPPITLHGKYEMACVGGKLVNSVPNISPTLNNNVFSYSVDGGVTFQTVTLPTGTYTTGSMQEELHRNMFENGDFTLDVNGDPVYGIRFRASIYLLRFQVILAANCQVDFTAGQLHHLLGFPSPVLLDGGLTGDTFTASSIALFTTGGEIYYVQTDAIEGGVVAGDGRSGLAGILRAVESTGLGFPVSLRDPSGDYQYFPLKSNVLQRIMITVYDGLNRLADFNGEGTAFELRFRPIQ